MGSRSNVLYPLMVEGPGQEASTPPLPLPRGRGFRRFLFLVPFSLFPFLSLAQAPDIRARLDLALTVDYRASGARSARLYTPLGRPSTVGLTLILESGFNVTVAERLQRLPGDSDGDIFDEAFIEDPGIWRVGKQYLPFGAGRLLHESVVAARIDSNLIAERAPVSLSIAQMGKGRQNGVVLRVGRTLGASLAVGDHFGINATSLGVVRRPEDAPGKGGGWKQVYGADATRRFGKLTLSGEYASLLAGPERALGVADLEAVFVSDSYRTLGLGYTHADGERSSDILRFFVKVHAARSLDLEPLLRLKSGSLYDVSVTMRLRL